MILAPPKEAGRTTHETPAAHRSTNEPNPTSACGAAQCRRLPAYGRRVLDLRERGLAPALAMLVCDGWAPVTIAAEHEPWVVVLPDDEPPEAFDFRICAGLFVYVLGDDLARVNSIVEQVELFAPRMVYSWSGDHDVFMFHRRVPG